MEGQIAYCSTIWYIQPTKSQQWTDPAALDHLLLEKSHITTSQGLGSQARVGSGSGDG